MSIECRKDVCTVDGRGVDIYALENRNGMRVEITNYGCIVLRLCVPDRDGRPGDVVLGYDDIGEYIRTGTVHGSVVGRYANRIGGAAFTLDGARVELSKNDNGNHLHGGFRGFHRVVWTPEVLRDEAGERLSLGYLSPDGEEGYPGTLRAAVVYTLREDNALAVEYRATTDRPTIVNLTNHAFFNLSAMAEPNVLDHRLRIDADDITAVGPGLIPTGELMPVAGTPFDFRAAKAVGREIESDHPQMAGLGGYDHNFALNPGDPGRAAIELSDPLSGRVMRVYTTTPGVQLYTGNGFDGSEVGKGGAHYQRWAGLCLETQFFPDSVNHAGFRAPILRPGESYRQETVYQFSVTQ